MTFFLLYSQYLVLVLLLFLKTKLKWINSYIIIGVVWCYIFFLIQITPILINEKVMAHVISPFYKIHGIILFVLIGIVIFISLYQFIKFLVKKF